MAPEDARVRTGAPKPADTAEADPFSQDAVAQRIAEMIGAVAAHGADPAGGVTRPGYSEAERAAHRLVGEWLRGLGMTVTEDAAGNTIAELAAASVPGSGEAGEPDAANGAAGAASSASSGAAPKPPIVLGSHLDSVPRGGNFDGVAGVVAAAEVVRALRARETPIARPIRVVCFAAEEETRFGESCIGSRAVAGLLPRGAANEFVDDEGVSLARAMKAAGLDAGRLSDARWPKGAAAAYLELHVEQGRVLNEQGVSIGLVEAIAGQERISLTVRGRTDHSGGTPMSDRADALAAAAEIVLAVESAAKAPAKQALRASVGRLDVSPDNIATVPGSVSLSVDVRDVDTERLRAVAGSIVRAAGEICERRGVSLESRLVTDTSPGILPTWSRQLAIEAAIGLGLDYRILATAAGRDAQVMNHVCPAGLVLVPSRRGLSHVPDEWTSSLDLARGVTLLAEWVVRLDASMARWESAKG
jgi:allantoate deiminase